MGRQMKRQFNYTVGSDGKIPLDIMQEIEKIHQNNPCKQMRLGITNERKRSLVQNAWFHKINSIITVFLRQQAKEQGNELYYEIDEDTTKHWIKKKFLGYVLDETGEKVLRKTSKLKTFEMNQLWQDLQIYFAPRGLDLPNPNEKE